MILDDTIVVIANPEDYDTYESEHDRKINDFSPAQKEAYGNYEKDPRVIDLIGKIHALTEQLLSAIEEDNEAQKITLVVELTTHQDNLTKLANSYILGIN
ncbi:MAG: hypothetical protein GY915_01330 [bacterium]|nr:hypothetical protein [bacterium]